MKWPEILIALQKLSISIALVALLAYFGTLGFDYIQAEGERMTALTTQIEKMAETEDRHLTAVEDSLAELLRIARVTCRTHANGDPELRFACDGVQRLASD